MLAPDPVLRGHVRLEPLSQQHVPGLAAASAGSPDLYRLTNAPAGETAAAAYVTAAQAARQAGTAAPFAVVRLADDTVIGSTRLWGLQWRAAAALPGPDTCEIGMTWLSADAIRTGASTGMKRLMLATAFDAWRLQRVVLPHRRPRLPPGSGPGPASRAWTCPAGASSAPSGRVRR